MSNGISGAPTGEVSLVRDGFYLTYPHNNGFCKDGRTMVLGRMEGTRASLWKVSPDSKEDIRICEFDVSNKVEKLLWFDVARETNRLVVATHDSVWMYDLEKQGSGECIYRETSPARMLELPAIKSDGSEAVIGLRFSDHYAALSIDLNTGKNRILFEKPWYANHFHFCPYDEAWMGFCHEGRCEETSDRVWGWHPVHAPEGRCLFDQNWGNPARELNVGHERWCFHAPAALAVAYGASPGEPRGTYEVYADGKPPRLVSRGNRHLHVNASLSGRWAVVDTSGPHDIIGKGWENAEGISDLLLVDMVSGEQLWLARSRIESHPSHPHPVFSPDEKSIFFNEFLPETRGNRVMRVENPWYRD